MGCLGGSYPEPTPTAVLISMTAVEPPHLPFALKGREVSLPYVDVGLAEYANA
jgi:hypothetical protein